MSSSFAACGRDLSTHRFVRPRPAAATSRRSKQAALSIAASVTTALRATSFGSQAKATPCFVCSLAHRYRGDFAPCSQLCRLRLAPLSRPRVAHRYPLQHRLPPGLLCASFARGHSPRTLKNRYNNYAHKYAVNSAWLCVVGRLAYRLERSRRSYATVK